MDEVSPVAARVRWRALLPLLLVLLLCGAAWYGWHDWQARQQQAQERAIEDARQIDALGQRLDTLRADLRAQGRLLQDAAASNRVLRDEVLGLGQRNALLEESVARLDARARQGHQALRLDEAELLLVLGAQRLHVAGDIDGARRAYALAATMLEGLEDPGLLNLRQTLAAERAALDALGPGPRAALAQRLEAVVEALSTLPHHASVATDARRPLWQRLLAPLLEVRPAGSDALMGEAERRQGEDALQVELTLARAALERGDVDGFHTALNRSAMWIGRLWPDSPESRKVRQELDDMREAPLQPQSPLVDSTLLQLRALREGKEAR
ncbi:uroporphyrinogen-III C-methyltransferase [Pseudoxanthomonas sp. J35]|uniref:uroporphyrinogen-III C-methyltransferase n=1 Tax=Pseudoxanthomonas sp. J35 TaxID=935852 RepID=UPI00048B37C1|nr:uroporphyrinogen-III C-methyltransferase [Pseudoxanthomonas sp. J35]